jgi:hypothetical protein
MQNAHRWEVRRRALSGQLPNHVGSHRDPARASVGGAVHLRVEGLGVECAGRGCNTGENRQGDQGGYDGLHDYFSKRCRQHHVACHRMGRIIAHHLWGGMFRREHLPKTARSFATLQNLSRARAAMLSLSGAVRA